MSKIIAKGDSSTNMSVARNSTNGNGRASKNGNYKGANPNNGRGNRVAILSPFVRSANRASIIETVNSVVERNQKVRA